MPDPIATNEIVKNVLTAYQLFSQEMQNINLKKMDLIFSIIKRVDAERTEEARNNIKNTYANE